MSALTRRLAGLSGREAGLLALLLLVVLPAALAILVAGPLLAAREAALARRAEALELRAWVAERDAAWQARAPGPAADPGGPPAAGLPGIEAALAAEGLRDRVTVLETGEAGRVTLRLEEAPFAATARVLERLGPELGYRPESLRLRRGGTPGSVALDLEAAPARP